MTTRGDTFVDTSGTGIISHTATGPNGGWTWGNTDGTGSVCQINASNQVKLTGSVLGQIIAASVGSDDQSAQVGVMADTNSFHVAVRASGGSSSSGNFYGGRFAAGKWEVWKFVSGSFTNLLSSSATLTPGDVAKIQAVGSTITFSVNGSVLLNTTDASITTGSPGFVVRSDDAATDPWIQNFLADAVTSGSVDGLMGAICL